MKKNEVIKTLKTKITMFEILGVKTSQRIEITEQNWKNTD